MGLLSRDHALRIGMDKAPDLCILCHTPEREPLLRIDSWSILRCPHCHLGFLEPRPSQGEIEKLYSPEYFRQYYDEGLDPSSPEFYKRLRSEDHRLRFIRPIKRSGRLLDIGCGYGYFLAAIRSRGYEVRGLDLSEWAGTYARGKLGIDVSLGSIQEGVFSKESFDIITMWHLLEHTPDPNLVLRQAREWLKKGGILVVDVPNYEGTDARYLKRAWDGWCLPYHLWHFTRGSLIKLLQSHGFRVVKYKDYHSEVIKKKLRAVLPLRPVARFIARIGSGTSIAVAAVREG